MMLKSFVVLFLTVASLASTTAQTLDSQHSFTPPDDVVDVIETGYGPVAGIIGVDYRAYRGIPFAAPPVGALRWQPPAPATAWGPTPRNAFASGPGCPQVCQNPAAACPTSTSEDCLTLDVYAPLRANASSAAAIKTEALKPVMVWIYGGRIWSGATQGTAYDSRFLANQTDTVVVLGNYRLGALGWLVTDQHNGNFGLLDQRFLLQWVQKNIRNFGGDQDRVTIFGESAGAVSVGLHMISRGSAGLFHAAIMESNPVGLPLHDTATGRALALLFAKKLNCTAFAAAADNGNAAAAATESDWVHALPPRYCRVLVDHGLLLPSKAASATASARHTLQVSDSQCLMRAAPDAVVAAQIASATHLNIHTPLQTFIPWSPVVDGDEVPCQPIACFEKRIVASPVPLIIGTTTEEARPFVYGALEKPLPWVEYDAIVAALFGISNFRTINDLYPSGHASDCRDALVQLVTDYVFTCASRHLASVFAAAQNAAPIVSASRRAANSGRIAATGSSPAFLYLFDHVASFAFWEPDFPYCSGHNCHGEELPFLFQTAPLSGSTPTADENALSATMAKFWGSMAYALTPGARGRFNAGLSAATISNKTFSISDGSGAPHTDAAAAWPPFDPALGTGPLMRLVAPTSNVIASYRPQFCAAWDSLGCHWD